VESVTTPGGTLPARPENPPGFSLPVTFTAAGMGSGTARQPEISTTQWYEPYIGLVRAQITSASFQGSRFLIHPEHA